MAFFSEPDRIMKALNEMAPEVSGFSKLFPPPELKVKSSYIDVKPQQVDVFSFGITFITLLLAEQRVKLTQDSNSKITYSEYKRNIRKVKR